MINRNDLATEVFDAMQDGVMLGGATHGNSPVASHRPEDGRVVGLGTATREHHLAGLTTESIGDVVARFIDGLSCET
jgi:hypothetical protein